MQEIEQIDRELRAAEIPQSVFAPAMGIHPSTWRRWRSGQGGPTIAEFEVVKKVAANLIGKRRKLPPAKGAA